MSVRLVLSVVIVIAVWAMLTLPTGCGTGTAPVVATPTPVPTATPTPTPLLAATVSTFAGTGTEGFVNGPAATAQFSSPAGLALDSQLDLYVADYGNHCIRKISNGTVSTFAGTGEFGLVNGPSASAQFHYPTGLAFDGQGNLYVADAGNHCIRLISNGQVSTFAGSGTPGFADGPAATAQFNAPAGVIVDGQGNVFVTDEYNHRVRKISGGQVTTVAGTGETGFLDGTALSAQFYHPFGIDIDCSGTLYVADVYNHRVRTISSEQVATFAGSGTGVGGFADGPVGSARFSRPMGISVRCPAGYVFVTDHENHRVRAIRDGQVFTLAGNGTAGYADGPGQSAQFNRPLGITLDGQGHIYVSESDGHRIRMIAL